MVEVILVLVVVLYFGFIFVNISLFRLWGIQAEREKAIIDLIRAMLIQVEVIETVIERIEFINVRHKAEDSHFLDELRGKITPDLTEGG